MKMYRVAGICMTFLVSALVAMDSPNTDMEQETPKGWVLEGLEVPPVLRLGSPSHAPVAPLQDFASSSSASSSSEQSTGLPSRASGDAMALTQPSSATGSSTTFFSSLWNLLPSLNKESVPMQPPVSHTKPTTPLATAPEVFLTILNEQQHQEEHVLPNAEKISPRSPVSEVFVTTDNKQLQEEQTFPSFEQDQSSPEALHVFVTTEGGEQSQEPQQSDRSSIMVFPQPADSPEMRRVLLPFAQAELPEQASHEQELPLIKEQKFAASTEHEGLLTLEPLSRAESMPILPSHKRRLRATKKRATLAPLLIPSLLEIKQQQPVEEQTDLCALSTIAPEPADSNDTDRVPLSWVEMVVHGALIEKVSQEQDCQVPALKSALAHKAQFNTVSCRNKLALSTLVIADDEMSEVALCAQDDKKTHQERKRSEKEKEKKAKLVVIKYAVGRQSRDAKRQSQSRDLTYKGRSVKASSAREEQKRAKKHQHALICKQWSKEK